METVFPTKQEAFYRTVHNSLKCYRNNNQGVSMLKGFVSLISPGKPVLELGCGNGELCRWLVRAGFKDVIGIDITDGPYEHKEFEFIKLDLTEDVWPAFLTGELGAVLCFDVLEHLEEKHIPDVMDLMCGYESDAIVFSVACYGAPPFHLTVKSPGWWLDMVLEHGRKYEWRIIKILERRIGLRLSSDVIDENDVNYALLFYGKKKGTEQ